jgi:gluconate kinase
MPDALLDSQLRTLEMPGADENAVLISANQSTEDMLRVVQLSN